MGRTSMADAFDPFSRPWLGERRGELIRRYVRPGATSEDDGIGDSLVMLTFLAPPDEQWDFLLELIAAAPDHDDVLGRIAAGPLEGLLGRYGPAVIERVERLAERDARFRRILTGVWQHTMPDEIWNRVCAARAGRN